MDAVKYLKTLSRMKEDDAFSVEEFLAFIGKTPEHKVETVEKWGEERDAVDRNVDLLKRIKARREELNIPIDVELHDYQEYMRNVISDIRTDLERHEKLIENLQWAFFNEQLRIDDCEDDIQDLMAGEIIEDMCDDE